MTFNDIKQPLIDNKLNIFAQVSLKVVEECEKMVREAITKCKVFQFEEDVGMVEIADLQKEIFGDV